MSPRRVSAGVTFPSCAHVKLERSRQQTQKDADMDDYQEELLEYQASQLDPLEPVDDATEL
ncbi:hypothetical protein [Pseudomonas lundensis]|uniref:hypothetical protein n=1 Tax=Pseudomonas lundensis TaxID=86185 RepID=UPI00114049F6|nr:hypothetical protein [Pseudomonas lundensis]